MKKIVMIILGSLTFSCTEKPTENTNAEASAIPQAIIGVAANSLHPINILVDFKDSTMSTIYGNDLAYQYKLQSNDLNYPIGSILYKVTWQQQADSLWFGGRIPANVLSFEKVSFIKDAAYKYESFEGNPLQKIHYDDEIMRTKAILQVRMAVAPN